MKCAWCQKPLVTSDRRRKYCNAICRHNAVRARLRKTSLVSTSDTHRKLPEAIDARGRQCRWCGAGDHETAFHQDHQTQCRACEKQLGRPGGRCGKCTGPRYRWGCPRCSRKPEGLVEVILLDESNDREKTVYRQRAKGVHTVQIAGGVYRVADPLVVTLPTERWVQVRA
jgi:hypothetical protein